MTEAQVERMDALPNIDVEVLFFIDSADLTNRAFATLAILGRALADERLGNQVFLIAGHTDASGPPDYNLALSERRAQTVRDFLIKNFGIAEDRLLARGFGPSRLKVPERPGSRLNRRVQVVNWTSEADPTAAAPPQGEPPQAAPQQAEPPPPQQAPRRRR
jgi:OOP family OmpA-OmpF porin